MRKHPCILAVLLIVVVLLANILFSLIPGAYRTIDATSAQLITPSAETLEAVNRLTSPVNIYLVASSGEEDVWLDGLLSKLSAASPDIHYARLSPMLDGSQIARYTDQTPAANSLIVASSRRSVVVDYEQIYQASYLTSGVKSDLGFAAQDQLVKALEYVTRDDLIRLYAPTNHGESKVSASLNEALVDANAEVLPLDLSEEVPPDASAVLLLGPQQDLTSEEAANLSHYLEGGGKLLLLTDYQHGALENLNVVTAAYSMTGVNGVVLEGDIDHAINGYQQYLLPDLLDHEITQSLIENEIYVSMPLSHAITIGELREGLLVDTLLETSTDAYVKLNDSQYSSLERDEGDLPGPFSLAVAASTDTTRVVWIASTDMINEEIDQNIGGANSEFFLSAVQWLCGTVDSVAAAPVPSLETEPLSIVSASTTPLVILLFMLPALALVIGLIMRLRKR